MFNRAGSCLLRLDRRTPYTSGCSSHIFERKQSDAIKEATGVSVFLLVNVTCRLFYSAVVSLHYRAESNDECVDFCLSSFRHYCKPSASHCDTSKCIALSDEQLRKEKQQIFTHELNINWDFSEHQLFCWLLIVTVTFYGLYQGFISLKNSLYPAPPKIQIIFAAECLYHVCGRVMWAHCIITMTRAWHR